MINTTYNFLPTSYTNYKDLKYHSHKKSELKMIYNNIINMSRKSPIYLLNMTNSNHSYAIAVKESAMVLHESMLDIMNESKNSFLDAKVAVSSDPGVVTAELVSTNIEDLPNAYEIEVKQLATTQVNTGKEFMNDSRPLKPGNYRFAIHVKDDIYDFQYQITKQDTSSETQKKLIDFINQAGIGIEARFEKGSQVDTGRIRLESTTTGTNGRRIFTLEDKNDDYDKTGIVELFQLDRMTKEPKNSIFTLNGDEKIAYANSFCINNTLNLSLKSTSDDPIYIDFVPDKEKVISGVESLVNTYNDIIHLGYEQSAYHHSARKLINELNTSTANYKNELEACGINTNDKKELVLDESLVMQAADDGELKKILSPSFGYISSILNRSSEIIYNPMNYLDKTIVSYKDVTKPGFYNPYLTSIYTGMIFNYYC